MTQPLSHQILACNATLEEAEVIVLCTRHDSLLDARCNASFLDQISKAGDCFLVELPLDFSAEEIKYGCNTLLCAEQIAHLHLGGWEDPELVKQTQKATQEARTQSAYRTALHATFADRQRALTNAIDSAHSRYQKVFVEVGYAHALPNHPDYAEYWNILLDCLQKSPFVVLHLAKEA